MNQGRVGFQHRKKRSHFLTFLDIALSFQKTAPSCAHHHQKQVPTADRNCHLIAKVPQPSLGGALLSCSPTPSLKIAQKAESQEEE